MQTQASKFIINREDLNVDPVTLVSEGLRIGRLPSCELVLNHPTVSRLHAGINNADGRFYFYNFSHSSGTTINGRVVPIESAEVLADGDVLQIGPYVLNVARAGDALSITVTLEVAMTVADSESRVETAQAQQPPPPQAAKENEEVSAALNVFWEKRKREAGKMQRVSPLRPQKPQRVLGKARFNWTPTRDLVRPWPFSIFVWGFAAVAVLSIVAAVVYAQSYAPAPISSVHARGQIRSQPPIAKQANATTCTACHTLTATMDTNCASCHQAEGFRATVTDAHKAAGIGCTDCHVEHQGTEFRPSVASLQTCTNCHNDSNTKTYKRSDGASVQLHTPHGGTVGYPVVGGKWVWTGLPDEEWHQKSAEVQKLVQNMRTALVTGTSGRDPDDVRRSAEFHALHIHRVKAVGGLPSNRDGEMSCSSCHKAFSPIDRDTPHTTCATCHDGDRGGKFEKVLAPDKPNCMSCHVQHLYARREWGRSLLNDLTTAAPSLQPPDAATPTPTPPMNY